MSINLAAIAYLISGILFILALRGLSSPPTARTGNHLGIAGMALAILTTLAIQTHVSVGGWIWMIIAIGSGATIGIVRAQNISMTAVPQLIALFHALVGLAAVLVAAGAFYAPQTFHIGELGKVNMPNLIEMSFGVVIGAITFSASLVAYLKLEGKISSAPMLIPNRATLNLGLAALLCFAIVLFLLSQFSPLFWLVVLLSMVLGVLLIIPIGGADMPVIISMLNSYSGWAAAGIGFTLSNLALIITGALVGSSGAILSYIMCKGMNRSFFSVLLGGYGGERDFTGGDLPSAKHPLKTGSAEDAAFLLKNAARIIIVPGYGMAVAQAQHSVKEMVDLLKAEGVNVKYAVHPVAGRMPGHMNVLLAEANVPYDDIFELDDINNEFTQTDVAVVIGANDVTNPAAKTNPQSPIYGMPVLDVEKAKSVIFIKRGIGTGYAGIENELFYRDNTLMLFADAKKAIDNIVKFLKG